MTERNFIICVGILLTINAIAQIVFLINSIRRKEKMLKEYGKLADWEKDIIERVKEGVK